MVDVVVGVVVIIVFVVVVFVVIISIVLLFLNKVRVWRWFEADSA